MTAQRIENDFGAVTLQRFPIGVTGIIVPWNWPISLLFMRVAAALATGNTVVCVPSPYATLAVLRTAEAAASALPAGVLNVVTGRGPEVGAALTAHPGVDKLSFTGSTATGIEVLRSAAGTIKRTSLELGGNDAALILDDATVDDALGQALLASAWATTGQVCYALKRVYVARSLHDAVVDSCLAAGAAVRGRGRHRPGDHDGSAGQRGAADPLRRFSRAGARARCPGRRVRRVDVRQRAGRRLVPAADDRVRRR
jgi:aldehyde dehydrogenase